MNRFAIAASILGLSLVGGPDAFGQAFKPSTLSDAANRLPNQRKFPSGPPRPAPNPPKPGDPAKPGVPSVPITGTVGFVPFGFGFGGPGYPYGGYGSPYGDPYFDSMEARNEQLRRQREYLAQEQAARKSAQDSKRKGSELTRKKNEFNRANSAMETGGKLFSAGSYNRAADRYREASKLMPDDPTPLFLLTQALFASKQYEKAAVALRDALRIDPQWLDLEFDARQMYGDDADALLTQMSDLAAKLQQNPADESSMLLLGYQLFVTGQKDRARKIIHQAAKLDNGDPALKPFLSHFDREDGIAVAPAPKPAKVVPAEVPADPNGFGADRIRPPAPKAIR
ncbi:MAG: tetratricopeptide repeat protein [Planctomycetia bacterium]